MTGKDLQDKEIRQEVFEGQEISVLELDGEECFLAGDIGVALGLEQPRKQVLNIFNRHREEFAGFHRVTKLVTRHKDQISRTLKYTVFNPEGVVLLTLLARTPKSTALRRWVSKFLARDMEKLRSHVHALEGRVREDHAKLKRLVAKLGNTTRLLKRAQAQLAARPKPVECLPPPPEPDYRFSPDPHRVIRINSADVLELIGSARSPKYDRGWFSRLLAAQTPTDQVLQKVLNALADLRPFLNLSGLN